MSMLARIMNKTLMLSYYPAYHAFVNSTKNVSMTQEKIFKKIISKNKNTIFGKKHFFSRIESYQHFKDNIPLSEYEDYLGYIEAIKKGKSNVLTKEKIKILQPTSGTTSASKYIPFTSGLKGDFHKTLGPWLYTMLKDRGVSTGKAYWSITPAVQLDERDSAVPIGFLEEADYFGFFRKLLIRKLFFMPGEITAIKDTQEFKYVTLFFLLKEKNVSLFSFWSPSFLLVLLYDLEKWKDKLIYDIRSGHITGLGNLSLKQRNDLGRKVVPDHLRAGELEEAFRHSVSRRYKMMWPNLSLISSWTDAYSREQVTKIAELFPDIRIQPKGLMATEGAISFPLANVGNVLAVCSHFFEFLEVNENTKKELCRAHELKKGKTYAVVITTNGGLYRYQLMDAISVEDFYNQCPVIRFMGRLGKISDLFGEKLNEFHLSNVLKTLLEKMEITSRFCLVAPESDEQGTHYVLYIQLNNYTQKELSKLNELALALDRDLRANVHYHWCRELSQLQPVKVFLIDKEDCPEIVFTNVLVSEGKKLGDIKSAVLSSARGWENKFKGSFKN